MDALGPALTVAARGDLPRLVVEPGWALPAGLRPGPAALRRACGLSLALHAAAVVALGLLVVQSVTSQQAVVAEVELVLLTDAPAPAAPPAVEALPAALPDPAPPPATPPEPNPPPAAPPPEPQAAAVLSVPAPAPPVPREHPRRPPGQALVRPLSRAVEPRPAAIVQESSAAPATAAMPPAVSAVPAPAPPERSSPSWLAGVSAWLLAHRSYPEIAKRLRQQGTVVVHFVVDREGRVLEVTLVHGSGTEALDQAAQELLRNARLPAFPPDMKLSQQSVTVPIRYRLE